MKTTRYIALAAIGGIAAGAALGFTPAKAEIIFQDSFESPSVNSWEVFQTGVGDNGSWFADFGSGIEIQNESIGITDAYDGEQYVELDSDPSNGGVFDPIAGTNTGMVTEIAFKTGHKYRISFAYKPRTNNTDDNGIALFALTTSPGGTFGSQIASIDGTISTISDWIIVTTYYTAEQGANAIGFLAFGGANSLGGFIDFVLVNEVPLPAALPLFIAGLGGVSFASRRKKRAAAA